MRVRMVAKRVVSLASSGAGRGPLRLSRQRDAPNAPCRRCGRPDKLRDLGRSSLQKRQRGHQRIHSDAR